MLEFMGLIGDRLLLIGTGVFAAFIYPRLAQEAIDRGHGKDNQSSRIKWMRIAGIIMIVAGALLAVFDLVSPAGT